MGKETGDKIITLYIKGRLNLENNIWQKTKINEN